MRHWQAAPGVTSRDRIGLTRALVLAATVALWVGWASAAVPAHTGDINGDGEISVVDVSCFVASTLATLGGDPAPICQVGTTDEVDLVCDGVINVVDAQRAATVVLYVLSLDPSVAALLQPGDADLDLIHNTCDLDDDNDGFDDECEAKAGTDPLSATDMPSSQAACEDEPIDCPAGCAIAGACVAANASEPGNPCRKCVPLLDASDWTEINGIPCNDGNACTLADQCISGACQGPILVGCNDLNPCTIDECDPLAGCVFAPSTGSCTDGNACTTGESCSVAGFCTGGTPINCDDANPCTADKCQAGSGCLHSNVPFGLVACDDGDVCTPTQTCGSGVCLGTSELNCNDGNPCTADACDASLGCLHTPLTGTSCADGDACTTGEQCVAGSCLGQPVEGVWGCGSTEEVVCTLFGNAGDTVVCALTLARANADQPIPTGIQFTLNYDPTEMQIDNFYDDVCFEGAGCFHWNMTGPGAFPMNTGHSVSIAPPILSLWAGISCNALKPCNTGAACTGGFCEGTLGFGGVVIANTTDPSAALTESYFAGPDEIVGDSDFLELQFKLLQTKSIFDAAQVRIGSLEGTDAGSTTLEAALYNGVLVTYEAE